MMRLPALLLFTLLASTAFAEMPAPPNPAAEIPHGANPFWEHPWGDVKARVPCIHKKAEHPNGDPAPCLCPKVMQHPNGDEKKVECVHRKLQHPGGDEKKVPCVHRNLDGSPKHAGGDTVRTPCAHWIKEHPDGDTVMVPCVHLSPKHPEGEPGRTVPCVHLVPLHADGDTVMKPCEHRLPKLRSVSDPPLDFYTDDAAVVNGVLASVNRLKELGVKFRWPRPLSIFYREPVKGNPDDNEDPFWSHCNMVDSVLVLTKDPADWLARKAPTTKVERGTWFENRARGLQFTIRHELGHAILGYKCVIPMANFAPHSLFEEQSAGGAISEGWADFVAVVLMYDQNNRNAMYKFWTVEDGDKRTKARKVDGSEIDVKTTQKVEFRVMCFLWDLYDNTGFERDEFTNYSFEDLFKVWSPSGETLLNGPLMPNALSFRHRLEKMHPEDQNIKNTYELNIKD